MRVRGVDALERVLTMTPTGIPGGPPSEQVATPGQSSAERHVEALKERPALERSAVVSSKSTCPCLAGFRL